LHALYVNREDRAAYAALAQITDPAACGHAAGSVQDDPDT